MITAVELDFSDKTHAQKSLSNLDEASSVIRELPTSSFLWLDFSEASVADSVTCLEALGIARNLLDDVIQARPVPYFIDLEKCLFFTLLDAEWSAYGVSNTPIAIFFCQRFMVTVHREHSLVVDRVLKTYPRNFESVAKTPGFLLYEFADHLCEEYTEIVCQVAEDTEVVEDSLFHQADESMFARVADLTRSVVEFYKIVVFAREVVSDLGTTGSPFIPPTTQPYLEKKATLLERLGSDVTTEREVLSETVHLYLGIVTHATNRFLSRLTALGTLFLPLSFLAGVYGMNFKDFPELEWPYALNIFWAVVIAFSSGVLFFMHRRGWL